MSFITNHDIVFTQMAKKKIRFWQIFDNDKTTCIAESADDEDLTIEDSIADLKEVLESLNGLVYLVIRGDKAVRKRKWDGVSAGDNGAGVYRFMLKLGSTQEQGGSPGANPFQNNTMFGMFMKLSEEKNAMALEYMKEKHDLERKLDEKLAAIEKKLGKKGSIEMDSEMTTKIIQVLDKMINKGNDQPKK